MVLRVCSVVAGIITLCLPKAILAGLGIGIARTNRRGRKIAVDCERSRRKFESVEKREKSEENVVKKCSFISSTSSQIPNPSRCANHADWTSSPLPSGNASLLHRSSHPPTTVPYSLGPASIPAVSYPLHTQHTFVCAALPGRVEPGHFSLSLTHETDEHHIHDDPPRSKPEGDESVRPRTKRGDHDLAQPLRDKI